MASRRIAALYDIHGNLPALEAAVAEVEAARPELIVCGGDVVGGPWPAECLDLLSAYGERVRWVRGNGEREVLGWRAGAGREAVEPQEQVAAWAAARLGEAHARLLESFEPTVRVGAVLFCHATPRSDEEILGRASSDERFRDALQDVDAELVVAGHTHQQYERDLGGMRMLNAGSIGLPYEGRRGAFWALLEGTSVDLRCTAYDVESMLAGARSLGFPIVDLWFGESLIAPTAPDEVAADFERMATGGS